MNVGNAIKKIRQEKGIRQNIIADKAGISNEYLSNIESGRRLPTLQSLEKICKALNISFLYLFFVAGEDSLEHEELTTLLKKAVEVKSKP